MNKSNGGFLASQNKRLGDRIFEKMIRNSNVEAFSGAQGRILYVLWENGVMSISELCKMTSLANSTMTTMLDQMEKNELIIRQRSTANRRLILISLTEKAQQYQKKYEDISEQMTQLTYAGFTEEEIQIYENMLRRIKNNLEKYLQRGKSTLKELNFKEYSDQILSQISNTKNIVLATCTNNHVTTRLVGHLLQGNTILFSTGIDSYKVGQIRQNPQVAYFLDGLNIEAIASIYGHPDTHPTFRDAYEIKYPEYVGTYGFKPDDVVVTATIQKIQIYSYENGAGKIIIDFNEERAYRIEL